MVNDMSLATDSTTRSKIKYLEADERLFPWEKLMLSALDSAETIDLDESDDPG